jgi:hypothetical protein
MEKGGKKEEKDEDMNGGGGNRGGGIRILSLHQDNVQSIVAEVQRIVAALEPFSERVSASVQKGGKRVREFLRFLVLKVLLMDTDATMLSPSWSVDKVWHACLRDTKLYREICDAILPVLMPAPRVIDHNPSGANDALRGTRYQNTRTFYKKAFGKKAPLKWWPVEGAGRLHPKSAACRNTVQQSYSASGMKIYVLQVDRNKYALHVEPSDSIDSLKQKLFTLTGITAADQRLLIDGTVMQNGAMVSDYKIESEETLELHKPQVGC